MSPGDVPITPQQPGRNGRAPLGTVTHSPHQLRKGGNRPGTALARPLSLGDPNQHPLPPQTRYLPTPIPLPWITAPNYLRRATPGRPPTQACSMPPSQSGPPAAGSRAGLCYRRPTGPAPDQTRPTIPCHAKNKSSTCFFSTSASHRCHQCSVFLSWADDAENHKKRGVYTLRFRLNLEV